MIQIQLQLDDKTINLDPLDNVTVPSCLDLNDTLQHQESQVNIRVEYDSYIHKILVENNSIPVTIVDDSQEIFTGIIDSGLSWVDNGTPEPLDNISLVIFDNSYKLQNTAETPITYINSSLTEIITNICNLCDLNFNDEGLLDTIKIPVFILNRDQEFYQAVNDLLFEYGFSFGFTGSGALTIINLKQPYDDQIIDNLFTGVKFSRTKRKYTGIELNYGKITTKYNEQVYFEGGDLGENNKIVPTIITPGSYYPFESAPQIESTEGQVYQEFASGYAETQNLYNGEKRYTRSKDTQLLYTENHNLVKDYSDNLTVDRTEFEYTQASVRFVNNTNEDAELKQLAIKATAYYRSPVQLVRGEGKKFKYDSKYIYDKDSANALAALMQHYFLGGNFKITFKTTQKLIPGQKTKINTGLSGIIADVIILSVTKDIYSEIYDITALTEQNITLDEKKYQIQKPMTASQVLERTEIDSITIQTIITEYYLSESRTELIGGSWTKTPPTATANKYIWTKNIYTYTDGRTEESKPVSISGEPGPQGEQGTQGPKGDTGSPTKDNLIKNSNFLKGVYSGGWVLWGSPLVLNTVNDAVFGQCVKCVFSEIKWQGSGYHVEGVKAGATYTISCYFLNPNGANLTIGVHHRDSSNINLRQDWLDSFTDVGSEWVRKKITFTTVANTTNLFVMIGSNVTASDNGKTAYWTNVKLEENNVATNWTLHPTEMKGDKGEDNLGFAVKLNVSDLSTTANGTIFVSGYENSVQANVNGYVRYLGNKISVTKTALKPNNQFVGWIAIPVAGGTPVLAYRTVAGQWKSISNGTSTNITGSNYVAIAEAKFESSIKATASSVIEPIRLDVLGGNIRSIYYGKASSNPSFSTGLVIGHFYLNTSNGNVYSFNGITWEVNNATDLQMQCMTDLLDIAQSSSTIGTPTFINKLVAYKIFVDSLLSKQITIDATEYGQIRSSNFALDVADTYLGTNRKIPTNGFDITAVNSEDYSGMSARQMRFQTAWGKTLTATLLYAQNLYVQKNIDATTGSLDSNGQAVSYTSNLTDFYWQDCKSDESRINNPQNNIFGLSVTDASSKENTLYGGGWIQGLKHINGDKTSITDAALRLGKSGIGTIGCGIVASSSSTNSGYVKFANGLIIQWGNKTVSTKNGYTCPYNIDFTTSNIFVSVMDNTSTTDYSETMYVHTITKKSFYVNRRNVSTSNWKWFAIGY